MSKRFRGSEGRGLYNCDNSNNDSAKRYRENSEMKHDHFQYNIHAYNSDIQYNAHAGGYGGANFYLENNELKCDSDFQCNTHGGDCDGPNIHRENSELKHDSDIQYNTHAGGYGGANFYLENNELKCDSDFQRNTHGDDCDGPNLRLENSEIIHDFQHNIDGSGAVSTSEDGHMKIIPGQKLRNYEILGDILGEGGFGRVLRVRNTVSGRLEVLKVAKNEPHHIAAAKSEVAALMTISCSDPKKQSFCLQMNSWFFANRHICIALPYLSCSLFDFMQDNNIQPYPVQQVAHITYQLCSAVQFLHLHGMVHMDIKPNNIMLVSSSYTIVGTKIMHGKIVDVKELDRTDIRLIDFGGVQREGEMHKTLITTAFYRPPEIIMGLGWSYACDTWSIACTIFELRCARVLFKGESELELLGIMEARLGQIPMSMASKTQKNYFINGTQNLNWKTGEEDAVRHYLPLEEYMSFESIDDEEFFELLQEMLKFEPTERISLEQALFHPFFGMLLEHQREVNNSGIC